MSGRRAFVGNVMGVLWILGDDARSPLTFLSAGDPILREKICIGLEGVTDRWPLASVLSWKSEIHGWVDATYDKNIYNIYTWCILPGPVSIVVIWCRCHTFGSGDSLMYPRGLLFL